MVMPDPGLMSTRSCRARRSLAAIFTVVVAFGLLAACGDDDSGEATPSGGETGSQSGGGHEGASPVAEDARHVAVSGRSFAFAPEEITVQAGEDIAIVFSSEDSLHDFTIDELDAHVSAEEGATSVGGFRAEESGRYSFYCSVEGHREAGMEGTLVVEA
jgi:plastocyanin